MKKIKRGKGKVGRGRRKMERVLVLGMRLQAGRADPAKKKGGESWTEGRGKRI